MILKNVYSSLLSAAVVVVLAACAVRGGPDAGGATGGTVISTGVVTGLGPVVVNGVGFDVSKADVSINDIPGSGDHKGLKIGMTVKVKGVLPRDGATAMATDIEANHEVEGRIAAVSGTQLTLLGQTVNTDRHTRYQPAGKGPRDLVANADVEVYGLRDAAGAIHASLIEFLVPGAAEDELQGTVSNLDTTANTFQIAGYAIRYDQTTDVDDGTLATDLKDGALVEVHLDVPGAGTPRATRIEFEGRENARLDASDGSKMHVGGYVSAVAGPAAFQIGPQAVRTTPSTAFSYGTAIQIGRQLEIGGIVSGSVLVAERIAFK